MRFACGARLDVYEAEPNGLETLQGMENVVLLPHLGRPMEETRTAMGMKVVEKARDFFEGRDAPDRIV